jgi:hypothetical protein
MFQPIRNGFERLFAPNNYAWLVGKRSILCAAQKVLINASSTDRGVPILLPALSASRREIEVLTLSSSLGSAFQSPAIPSRSPGSFRFWEILLPLREKVAGEA